MPYVQVKQKYQVTIPAAIRKKIAINEGDMLEAVEKDGLIVLIPKLLMRKNTTEKSKPSLLSLAGANEGSGLYESAQEIDDTIAKLRNEWS